jgi:diketogulonate reductase-like aldo/keto reductase
LALGRPELAPFSEKYQKTPAQVALNWLSSKPNVFPIPRASTVDHVMENLGALGWRLSEADIERLDRFFPPPPS